MEENIEKKYDIPDVILNPPEKYDKIVNEFGVCGKKPNIVFGGSVHRLWVLHVVNGVEDLGVDGYIESYGPMYEKETQEEMREAIHQALDFYEEYKDEFEYLRKKREEFIEKFIKQEGIEPKEI